MPANRQTVPRADREAEILGAARSAFVEVGIGEATVAAVARRAGMTAANVHYYFPTKEALAAAVVETAYDELFVTLAGLPDPVERLEGYVRFHLDHHALRTELQALAIRSADVARLLERREGWLQATVADVLDDELARRTLSAVVTGLIEVAVPPTDPFGLIRFAIERLQGAPPMPHPEP